MSSGRKSPFLFDRRALLKGALTCGSLHAVLGPATVCAAGLPAIDATFVFTSDIHACRMGSGLSPHCAAEGKTDANLRRHIAAINRLPEMRWPREIDAAPTGLASAGTMIGKPLGVVIGGDMTDDGGGQVTLPGEGTQLLQFSRRYQEGPGADRIHFPVYVGLGNHDLDQDGPPPQVDWYRRELRDYVELNHRPSVIFKPLVPAGDYDLASDDYSWDWGGLHLVQTHRFAGDRTKGAVSGIPWLEAGSRRPCRRRPARRPVPALRLGQILARTLGPAGQHISTTPAAAHRTGGATRTARHCSPRSPATMSSASFTATSTKRR